MQAHVYMLKSFASKQAIDYAMQTDTAANAGDNAHSTWSLMATSAASWYSETARRSTHPSRRNPLGLPSPIQTIASTGACALDLCSSLLCRVSVTLAQLSERSHRSRCVSNWAWRSVRVSRPGASAGTRIGSGSFFWRRITRRTLPPFVTWVQPSVSVTEVRFVTVGRFLRELCGIV